MSDALWIGFLVGIAAVAVRVIAGKAALITLLERGVGVLFLLLGIILVSFLIGVGWRLAGLMFSDFEEER